MNCNLSFLWCCAARNHVSDNEIIIDPPISVDTVLDWFNQKNDVPNILDKEDVSEQELAALCTTRKNFFDEDVANQTNPNGFRNFRQVRIDASEDAIPRNTRGGNVERTANDPDFEFTFNGTKWMSKTEEAFFEFTFNGNGGNWVNSKAPMEVSAKDPDDLNTQAQRLDINPLRHESSGVPGTVPIAEPDRKVIATAVNQASKSGSSFFTMLAGLCDFFRHLFSGVSPNTASVETSAENLHRSFSIRQPPLSSHQLANGAPGTKRRIGLDRLPDIRSTEFKELLNAILANRAEYDVSEILIVKDHYSPQSAAAVTYYESAFNPYSLNRHLEISEWKAAIGSYEKELAERKKTQEDLAKL